MKKIDNSLLYRYSFLSDIQSNPIGSRAIFTQKNASEEENKYHANLFLYENKKITKLTSCNTARNAFWLDDDTIAFLSDRDQKDKEALKKDKNGKNTKKKENAKERENKDEVEDDKKTIVYKKSVTSPAEAEIFAELRGAVSNVNILSNGKLLYTKNEEITSDESVFFAGQEKEEGYMRIRKIPFYQNGGDFSFHKKNSLYLFDTETKKETKLNIEDYNVESYNLNKEKNKVVIMAQKIQTRDKSYTALFEYSTEGNAIKNLLSDDTYSIKDPYAIYIATYWNNKVLFLGSTMEKHGLNENRKAYLLEGEKLTLLCGDDVDYLNSGVQDMVLGGGKQHSTRQGFFDYISSTGTSTTICRMNEEGTRDTLFSFDGSIHCFDYVDDKLLFVGLSEQGGQELYLEGEQISDFHDFLSEYYIAKPQSLSVQSTGITVDGFVLLPEDYNSAKSVGAVLEIHGGPKTAYQKTYFHEMQLLVAQGYVVLFCNPRGSAGKGNEFFDIFGQYGDVDYQNIMDFTDLVLKQYDKIDADRLFVTGGSYGGYMTNHIVGKTNRFRAAVTQRCISNWTSMYGTSDIGYYFCPDQHRTSIDKESFWRDLWDVSPLKNIDKVQTPTLIIHSDKDYRCPLEQGYQFFTALLDRGVDSELLVFHDEHHGLSREGKPHNRIVRLNAIKDWFKKYDKK